MLQPGILQEAVGVGTDMQEQPMISENQWEVANGHSEEAGKFASLSNTVRNRVGTSVIDKHIDQQK